MLKLGISDHREKSINVLAKYQIPGHYGIRKINPSISNFYTVIKLSNMNEYLSHKRYVYNKYVKNQLRNKR